MPIFIPKFLTTSFSIQKYFGTIWKRVFFLRILPYLAVWTKKNRRRGTQRAKILFLNNGTTAIIRPISQTVRLTIVTGSNPEVNRNFMVFRILYIENFHDSAQRWQLRMFETGSEFLKPEANFKLTILSLEKIHFESGVPKIIIRTIWNRKYFLRTGIATSKPEVTPQ